MSSPIHSYLFSPPPSPPSLPVDARLRSPALTSLASLLPPDLVPRQSLDGSTMKARSPRTPQQSRFALDTPAFPIRKDTFTLTITPSPEVPTSPKVITEKSRLSVPINVPTQTVSLSLPRPLLRLIFLGVLVLASVVLLCFAPGVRLPSLRAASTSRRLAWAPDGKSFAEAVEPIKDWADARDRDYVPPQIFAGRLSRRAVIPNTPVVARNPTPPPKATRPSPRPLPETHELFALQSYILQSSYNILPHTFDASRPLDANFVLGYAADETALEELEAERANDVVVWYGVDGLNKQPHELLGLLHAIHGSERHPTLIPVHNRPDKESVLEVLKRLGVPVEYGALAMIGNRLVAGDLEEIEEMRASGKLGLLLGSIGWNEEENMKRGLGAVKRDWKPKFAKVEKKEKTEVEHALEAVKRK